MLNYLKLDLRCLRRTMGWYYIMIPIFLLMYPFLVPNFFINMSFFFMLIFASTPFSIETAEGAGTYYRILPGSARQMVGGRYLLLLLVLLGFTAIDICMLAAVSIAKAEPFTNAQLSLLALYASVALIAAMMQYPLYYKFGFARSRIISMFIYFIPVGIIFALPKTTQIISPTGSAVIFNTGAWMILAACDLLALLVSYWVSCRIAEKNE